MTPSFSIGALGGTFDHFHKGHEHFLEFASQKAETILIGVTNQSLIREKQLSSTIQPYEVRTQAVRRFCESKDIKFEIVELTDPFGPTLGQRQVDCLIVTELTEQGGEVLNDRRKVLSLEPLPLFVCSMLRDESGEILNSTRIRQGLVNRDGKVFDKVFNESIQLKESQREFFKKPLGEIVSEPSNDAPLIAVVGDVCLSNFRKNNWSYNLGVFDKKTERESVDDEGILSLVADAEVRNPAGTIQTQAFQKIKELLKSIEVMGSSTPKHLFIDGEEDLMTAVLILMLPLSSLIYYGQPGEGMVRVFVDVPLKEQIYSLLH